MTYGTLRTTPAKLMLNQNQNLAPRENLEVNLNPEIRDLEVLQVQVHLPLGLGAEVEEAEKKDLAQGPRGPEKGEGGEDILVPHAVALGQGHAHGEMTEERDEATQAAAVRGRGPGRGGPIEGEIGQGTDGIKLLDMFMHLQCKNKFYWDIKCFNI